MAWEFMSASVAGSSHRVSERSCEDHCYVAVHASGALIAIVADGVGSAARGGLAAQLAVSAVSTHLQGLQGSISPQSMLTHLGEACVAASSRIRDHASNASTADLATTLSAVWLDETYAAAIHIGDGFGVVAAREATPYDWHTWLAPQRGEYANETSVLRDGCTDSDLAWWPSRIDVLCLSTDGMLKLALLNTSQPHAPFFNAILRAGMAIPSDVRDARLADFLRHEHVTSRTDDDTTLVVAWRVEGA